MNSDREEEYEDIDDEIEDEDDFDEEDDDIEDDDIEDEEDNNDDDDDDEDDNDINEEDLEDDDSNLVDISYVDDRGILQKEKIPYSELQAMYKFAKEAPGMIEQYKLALKHLNNYEVDSLFSSINKYRSQGYTDDQILEGLTKLRQQGMRKQVEEPKEFDDIQEAVKYHVEKAVKPYIEKQIRQEAESYARGNQSYNNDILRDAMEEYGWDYDRVLVTEAMIMDLKKVKDDIFPDFDFTQRKLNKAQARVLIGTALGQNRIEEKQEDDTAYRKLARNIVRQANAPKVLSGGKSRKEVKEDEDRVYNRDSRNKRADRLF